MQNAAKAPINEFSHNKLKAHQLTFEEFASKADAQKLDDHDRKWRVMLMSAFVGFSDAETSEEALRDVHRGTVRLSLFSSRQMKAADLPPNEVLNQYPDVVAWIAALG